jgi:fatty acid desaturase
MGKGGKGGEVETTSQDVPVPRDDSNEVLIDGMLYNVSAFRHPGGSILKYLTGNGDATEAFTEFHNRSEKAKKYLNSLPHRPAPADVLARRQFNSKPGLTKDFAALRNELKAEGYFKRSVSEIVYRVFEILLMHVIGVYLIVGGFPLIVRGLGVIVLGVVQGRCGWLMHEAGHYSLTTNIFVDSLLQAVIYGTGCGMSGLWWRNQHNRHHATPQKLKHDVDLDTLPLVAFNSAILNSNSLRKKPILRLWLKAQAFLFIPVSCLLVALGWQLFLHPRHIFRSIKTGKNSLVAVVEAISMVVRYCLFGLLFHNFTWSQAIGTYLLYNFFGASYIFTNFSLSHTHLPVSNPDAYLHWVEYAALHTTNIAPGPICNWWMAYLNFQIEHHLFPSMPQVNHPVIHHRVKKLFEKHGLTYDVRPYFSCLWDTLANLHTVGNGMSEVKSD